MFGLRLGSAVCPLNQEIRTKASTDKKTVIAGPLPCRGWVDNPEEIFFLCRNIYQTQLSWQWIFFLAESSCQNTSEGSEEWWHRHLFQALSTLSVKEMETDFFIIYRIFCGEKEREGDREKQRQRQAEIEFEFLSLMKSYIGALQDEIECLSPKWLTRWVARSSGRRDFGLQRRLGLDTRACLRLTFFVIVGKLFNHIKRQFFWFLKISIALVPTSKASYED